MLAISLTSCSDWFDVSPKTDVKADELFQTAEGFESALAGIYISMTDGDCYGHDMSFGLIDSWHNSTTAYPTALPTAKQYISMSRNRKAMAPSRVWLPSGRSRTI